MLNEDDERLAKVMKEKEADEKERARALKHISGFLFDLESALENGELINSFWQGRIESIKDIFPIGKYVEEKLK